MVVQHVGWLEEVLRFACVLNKSDGHLGTPEDPSETQGFAALWERSAGMSKSLGDISRIKGRASLQKVTPPKVVVCAILKLDFRKTRADIFWGCLGILQGICPNFSPPKNVEPPFEA